MVDTLIFRSLFLAALFFASALAPSIAFADDEDAAAVRPFPADRPGKANGPFTVDEGHFAVESDFVNIVNDQWSSDSITTRSVVAGDPLLKWGVRSDTDIELQLGGYQHIAVKDRSTGITTRTDGYGDDVVRLKYNVMGNDGSDVGVAILPYMKLPLATESLRKAGLTNNSIEGGLILPVNINLPHDFSLGYQTEVDANRNTDNNDFHANFVNIALLSHPLPGDKDITATLELFSSVSARKSSPNIYTLDPSFAYQVLPNLAFDIETDIGLNRDAPDAQMIGGVAWVY
jgi:hypothetical protein